jgi:hypothetical protein
MTLEERAKYIADGRLVKPSRQHELYMRALIQLREAVEPRHCPNCGWDMNGPEPFKGKQD